MKVLIADDIAPLTKDQFTAIKERFKEAITEMNSIPILEIKREGAEVCIDRKLRAMGQSEELIIELRDKIIEVAYASHISIDDLLCHIQRLKESKPVLKARFVEVCPRVRQFAEKPPKSYDRYSVRHRSKSNW